MRASAAAAPWQASAAAAAAPPRPRRTRPPAGPAHSHCEGARAPTAPLGHAPAGAWAALSVPAHERAASAPAAPAARRRPRRTQPAGWGCPARARARAAPPGTAPARRSASGRAHARRRRTARCRALEARRGRGAGGRGGTGGTRGSSGPRRAQSERGKAVAGLASTRRSTRSGRCAATASASSAPNDSPSRYTGRCGSHAPTSASMYALRAACVRATRRWRHARAQAQGSCSRGTGEALRRDALSMRRLRAAGVLGAGAGRGRAHDQADELGEGRAVGAGDAERAQVERLHQVRELAAGGHGRAVDAGQQQLRAAPRSARGAAADHQTSGAGGHGRTISGSSATGARSTRAGTSGTMKRGPSAAARGRHGRREAGNGRWWRGVARTVGAGQVPQGHPRGRAVALRLGAQVAHAHALGRQCRLGRVRIRPRGRVHERGGGAPGLARRAVSVLRPAVLLPRAAALCAAHAWCVERGGGSHTAANMCRSCAAGRNRTRAAHRVRQSRPCRAAQLCRRPAGSAA
jgi:hypothetical protein